MSKVEVKYYNREQDKMIPQGTFSSREEVEEKFGCKIKDNHFEKDNIHYVIDDDISNLCRAGLTEEVAKQYLEDKKLEITNAEFISGSQYMELSNPKFIGQTRVNDKGVYHMLWESNGKQYVTTQQLKD